MDRATAPDLLDDLAANAFSVCLGDEQFACGIYRDIRDQAIRAAERWRDVQFRIQLSSVLAKG